MDVTGRLKEKKMKQKGSYTVEAALLMGIILSVLVSIIYIGFWYHDKSFLQSAAYEAACAASLHKDDDTYQIGEAAQTLTKGRMLGTGGLQVQTQDGKEKASVEYHGNFRIPGMITAFFSKEKLEMKESCSLSTERPSEKIQKIRGICKVIRRVGGDSD